MGVLSASLAPRAVDPFADHYYTSTSPVWSIAGVNVSEDGWKRVSTAFACQRILRETVGSLPCKTYRRRPDGGKEEAPELPLYDLLHNEPNDEQTASEWFETMTGWAAVRDYAYSEIVSGPRGVEQLIPLTPESVRKERVSGSFGSAARYEITEPDGHKRTLLSDEVFRLRGAGPVMELGRDTFGIALAAEQHQARSFSTMPRPAGGLKLPSGVRLSDEAHTALKTRLKEYAGKGAGQIMILEDGADWAKIGMTNEEAQWLAARQFSVIEVCRWFRIPPHMVGDLQAGASYASIEMMSLEFVIYTMLPWFRRWEQAIARDLIVPPIGPRPSYFAEFLVTALLRGDAASRFAAYAVGRQWGWLSVNDIRRFENMNPIPGGDTYLSPLNMVPATGNQPGALGSPTAYMILGPDGKAMQLEDGSPAAALAALFANDAASAVLHKEQTAMRKLSDKATNGDWEAGVRTFYGTHGAHVAAKLHIPAEEAEAWAERQMNELLSDGPAALERWTPDALASLALETA